MEPIPFDRVRRVDRRPQPDPDLYAAILARLESLSEEIDGIADFVIRLAARDHRPRDG